MLLEVLKEKTLGRKIDIPVYVVFSEKENLSDNGKIMETLQSQAKEVNFKIVESSHNVKHQIAEDQYGNMWKEEKKIIKDFVVN